ncbi:hypothetical protein FYJ83_07775 [Tissierella sp. DSM 105185]|uniref:Uncharacterized protein n=1 Tax=Tissierella pigra TaxID=2607614 RepID=A0A6N7XV96_9FIRM|nr:hypothetical protein [Tissierella pigra]
MNMTPVPNGTTQVNVSWGKEALQGAGKGANFNSNGHTTPNGQVITNGQQVTDTFGDRMLDSDSLSNFKIEGYVTKNGQTYVQWSADITVSEKMIKDWPQVPKSVQEMAKRHSDTGGNLHDPKFIEDMVAIFKRDYPTTNPNYDYEKALRTIMLDVDWFDRQSMAMFPIGLIFETTETHKTSSTKAKEEKKNQMPPEGKGPTTCVASNPYICLDSYREVFLYSYTTTTDLPTPPTRNHGPCPAYDNVGFKEWDSAWGENYFPKAGDGEHWKYWNSTNVNKGYNKSIHYETRGVVPGATNPANIINGRPVETTQWTPLSDAKYETFLAEPVGKIDYTWVDNSSLLPSF